MTIYIEVTEKYSGETKEFDNFEECLDWHCDKVEELEDNEESVDFEFYVTKLIVNEYTFTTQFGIDFIEELNDYGDTEYERMIVIISNGIVREDDLWGASNLLSDSCIIDGYDENDVFEEYLDMICWFDDIPTSKRQYINIETLKYDFECGGMTMLYVDSQNCFIIIGD